VAGAGLTRDAPMSPEKTTTATCKPARVSLPIADLLADIADDLAQAARIFRTELRSDNPYVAELSSYVENFRGKQIRPALVLLSAQACGGIRPAHHVLAAVVEMVHIATLVHDDVLDEADLRRRTSTVSRRWGNESAVLLGDLLFSHAFRLCSSLDSQFASQEIGRTAVALCGGELRQVGTAGRLDLCEDEYFAIITGKTASLIGTCCLLGAHYAGADSHITRRLAAFGQSLGTAFQITDDLLDLVGDEGVVGKSLGRDVDKGKLTLPLIHALRSAEPGRRAELLALLRSDTPDRHRAITRILLQTESIAYAQQAAGRLVREAVAMLDDLPETPARATLCAMAQFVIARQR